MKRCIDFSAALIGLVLLSPLLLGLAWAIRRRMGSPVIFRQTRPGRGGQPFTILKFRTMTDGCDPRGQILPDAARLTPLGCWLRSSSLDELPELINVLRGEMSLVGPRPLLPQYLPYYTPREALRHQLRPGITGWAQINGRNHLGWDQRLALDVWYVENRSLWLDLKILWLTCGTVLRRSGVAADPDSVETDLDVERRQAGRLREAAANL